jgi:hypothetical protein
MVNCFNLHLYFVHKTLDVGAALSSSLARIHKGYYYENRRKPFEYMEARPCPPGQGGFFIGSHYSMVVLKCCPTAGCNVKFRTQAAQAAFVAVAEDFSPTGTPTTRKYTPHPLPLIPAPILQPSAAPGRALLSAVHRSTPGPRHIQRPACASWRPRPQLRTLNP